MEHATTQLLREFGPEVLATLGGAPSSALEAMKAKLLKRRPRKSRLDVITCLDSTTLPKIRKAVDNGCVVAVRCARSAAQAFWPAIAEVCASRVEDDHVTNEHVGKGSFVALNGDACYCFGGFKRQRDTRDCAAAVVREARRRSEGSQRDFYIVRPLPVFGPAERKARLDHLFAAVPERHLLQIDEEGAYGASNEICAAKFAKTAASFKGIACVVDATACIGGNSIAFARKFPHVVSIEVNEARSHMLKHNVAHIRRFEQLGRVDVHCGDCIETLPKLDVSWAHTLVFADPPWGGRHYEAVGPRDTDTEKGVHFKGKGSIEGFVETVASLSVPRLLLKVPHTFDVSPLVAHPNVARCDARAVADKVQCVSIELKHGKKRHICDTTPEKQVDPLCKKKKKKKKKNKGKRRKIDDV